MLELGDPELELVDRLARGDPELGGDPGRRARRALANAACLSTPAPENVGDDRSHLVTLDTEPAGQLVGEIVGSFRTERKSAEPGQGQRLEWTAVLSGTGHAVSMRAAGGDARASTTGSSDPAR